MRFVRISIGNSPMKSRLAGFVAALMLLSNACAPAAPTPATKPAGTRHASTAPFSARWEKDIVAFEKADKENPPPRGAILFIGSSSTLRWKTLAKDFPEYKVINRGFGGSVISDATYFADRIVIPYRPRLIVLQAGSNDIALKKSPEQVAEDFKQFVNKVRAALPQTRIAYASINPAASRWDQRERQQKANQLIRDYIEHGENLDYIDLWSCFLSPEGTPRDDLFGADRLHNNAEGYKIRAAVVRPHLKAVTDGPK